MMQPADAHLREQALDITQSFAVTAPAGSGKTELLTRRFLKLLAVCQQPEDILCITFTRKAAEEMRARIVQALERGMATKPEDATQAETWLLAQPALANMRERNWHLLHNTNRLQIMTIDSLCRKLAQHLPFESGLGSLPGTLDTPETLYQQAARNTLARLETDTSLRPALADFLLHLDNQFAQAEQLISNLLGKREQWFPHLLAARGERQALENNIQLLVDQQLQTAAEHLQPYAETLPTLMRFAADNLRDKPEHFTQPLTDITELPDSTAAQLPAWRAIASFLLSEKNEWRKAGGINKNIGFPSDKTSPAQEYKRTFCELLDTVSLATTENVSLLNALQTVRQLPDAHYTENRWITLEHVTAVMMQAVAELKVLFAAQQQSDFTDITMAALQALGDEEAPTDLALRLDYRIQHILVDEFQDTAKPQYDLLAKLTRGWQEQDGRTLFVVGDAMQSCYGFREANVGIFMKARQQGIGNVLLHDVQLHVNFRSQENIVQWVNATFSTAFPAEENLNSGATTYCTAIAAKPALPEPAVVCHGFVDDDGGAQAEKIAALICNIQQQHPQDTIAILVRSRAPLQSITPVLRAHNIDWQATDIEPLAGEMAVLDLFTLTRALLSHADEMAWMALLRTPWFGLANADLLALALHRQMHAQTLWQSLCQWQHISALTADARGILQRSWPILLQTVQQSHRKSLRERVQGCWQALGGLQTLRSSAQHEQCLRFLDLLEQHEQGGAIVDMPRFERALDKLYANAPAHSPNPVQIMTMHKSKGLQFDHVFLPQLGKKSGFNDAPLLLWHEHISNEHHGGNSERLLMDIVPEAGQDKAGSLYEYLGKLKQQTEQHETLRVLYVACTRAIKHLHLFGAVKTPKKIDSDYQPAKNTMLAAIWPAFNAAVNHWTLCDNTTVTNTDENDEEQEEVSTDEDGAIAQDITLTHLRRLPAAQPLPVTEADTLMQRWRGHEYSNPDDMHNRPAAENLEQFEARISGTLLHRLLHCITEDGISHWSAARIVQQKNRWQQQLQAQGLLPVDATAHSARIAEALINMLQDPRGQWLLDNRHTASGCEYTLSDGVQTHMIDRTFIENGVRWIVDYKSAMPVQNESHETFLQRQTLQHREQLTRYRNLFTSLGEQTVRCALYFPGCGLWTALFFE